MTTLSSATNPTQSPGRTRCAACALALAVLAALPACNTVSGIGADIQNASDATRDAFRSDTDQPKTASTNDGTKPEGD